MTKLINVTQQSIQQFAHLCGVRPALTVFCASALVCLFAALISFSADERGWTKTLWTMRVLIVLFAAVAVVAATLWLIDV